MTSSKSTFMLSPLAKSCVRPCMWEAVARKEAMRRLGIKHWETKIRREKRNDEEQSSHAEYRKANSGINWLWRKLLIPVHLLQQKRGKCCYNENLMFNHVNSFFSFVVERAVAYFGGAQVICLPRGAGYPRYATAFSPHSFKFFSKKWCYFNAQHA